MRNSEALMAGHDGIADWLDNNVDVETHTKGKRNALGQVVDGIKKSAAELNIGDDLVWLSSKMAPAEFGAFIAQFSQQDALYEYFAGELGAESLRRAQTGVNRIAPLLKLLAEAAPPERAIKFLQSAAKCFLFGFDRECIAMCRGAVEVLVEESFPDALGPLGKRISQLRKNGGLARQVAADMHAINDQAKEVLHDDVAGVPPDAEDCLKRLSRVLAALFPKSA